MQIYEDVDGKGRTVLILEKQDGRDLIRALEYATAPQKVLRDMKALPKSSRAFKIANEIENTLSVF